MWLAKFKKHPVLFTREIYVSLETVSNNLRKAKAIILRRA